MRLLRDLLQGPTRLAVLDVQQNAVTDAGMAALAAGVCANNTLTALRLDKNKTTPAAAESLAAMAAHVAANMAATRTRGSAACTEEGPEAVETQPRAAAATVAGAARCDGAVDRAPAEPNAASPDPVQPSAVDNLTLAELSAASLALAEPDMAVNSAPPPSSAPSPARAEDSGPYTASSEA